MGARLLMICDEWPSPYSGCEPWSAQRVEKGVVWFPEVQDTPSGLGYAVLHYRQKENMLAQQ
jgi:hypothetical protein